VPGKERFHLSTGFSLAGNELNGFETMRYPHTPASIRN
jgi:hypothetical protein